jgi:uncharacterized Fe-S cluster protein YjdI
LMLNSALRWRFFSAVFVACRRRLGKRSGHRNCKGQSRDTECRPSSLRRRQRAATNGRHIKSRQTHLCDLAARCVRGWQEISALKKRAWGMPGARCTRSLVCAWGSKYAHEYSQRATGNHPAFPHAMVYSLYRALPGDRLSCHRHLRKTGSSAPGRADLPSANLTPASRRQDHTTSPSASAPFVSMPLIAHRPKSALPSHVLPDAAASTASRPNVRDDGQRPSLGTGWRRI